MLLSIVDGSINTFPRVQRNASDKDTFMPKVISLQKDNYESMVRVMKLPFRAIETTAVVGPFFWSSHDQDDDDPHLRESKTIMTIQKGPNS